MVNVSSFSIRVPTSAKKLSIHAGMAAGTVDENGQANIHPVAYHYASNNKFHILTEKESKKVHKK
jgi:general stress protein 26